MLSWNQIGEASAAGIEIGAHTEHHPELDQLPASSVGQELRDSKNLLEERLGIPVTGMSYPFGYSNRSVRVAAGAAGYQHACAVRNRYARGTDDVLALPRLTIGRPTGPDGFARIVGGRRLPAEFVAYRGLTMGWSVVRHARSAARWLKQRE